MTVFCKHPDWQAEVNLGQVRPGSQIRPWQTGNTGLFLGTALRQLERECSMWRWCCTVWGSFGKGARSAVLYKIKSITKSTFPIVQRSEALSCVVPVHWAQCVKSILELLAGERNSDVDSAITLCSFEHSSLGPDSFIWGNETAAYTAAAESASMASSSNPMWANEIGKTDFFSLQVLDSSKHDSKKNSLQ